jgi:2-polyprenyl-3-methyl-5-hydroxy-6-metoxy-1,4-benzoquinol methylase
MVASVLRFDHPGIRKHGWQLFYSFLASWFNTSDWLFMNYGYAGGPNEAELCPEDEPHRCFIQMYAHTLRLAGSVAGRDVLEVGCGRGGGCSWIARTQSVRSMTGVDLAGSAIALCKRTHRVSNLRFEQGDAEDLAFPDASFHVVVNVESCHHYPSLPRFLSEVERVLRPGGAFCVATYWDRPGLARFEQALRDASLDVVVGNNIAPRVLDALQATDTMKSALIQRHAPRVLWPLLNHFAAVDGSAIHRGFMDGSIAYVSALLRKPLRRAARSQTIA